MLPLVGKRLVGRLALLLAVLMGLSGCTYLFPTEEEMLAPPLIEPQEVTYKTQPVAKGDIERRIQVSAAFTPSVYADVFFPYSGRLSELLVREGLDVQEGDVLAEFSTENIETRIRDQQYAVERAQLNYEQRLQNKSNSETIYATSEGEISQLRVKVGDDVGVVSSTWGYLMRIMDGGRMSVTVKGVPRQVRKGDLVYCKSGGNQVMGFVYAADTPTPQGGSLDGYNWNGTVSVEFDGGSVGMKAGDTVSISSTNGGWDIGSGEAELQGAVSVRGGSGMVSEVLVSEGDVVNVGDALLRVRTSDDYAVKSAQLDLQQAEAALRDLRTELERTRVVAPITGRVSWIATLNLNDWINSYTDLCRIADPESLILEYRGDRAVEFTIGMEVTFKYKGTDYSAEVVANPSSLPREKNGATQYVAHFMVKDLSLEEVSYSDSGSIVAILESKQDVIVLQKDKVNSFWGRKYVNVLEDGVKVEKDVEIGIETSTEVEVVKGLNVGDQVIIR